MPLHVPSVCIAFALSPSGACRISSLFVFSSFLLSLLGIRLRLPVSLSRSSKSSTHLYLFHLLNAPLFLLYTSSRTSVQYGGMPPSDGLVKAAHGAVIAVTISSPIFCISCPLACFRCSTSPGNVTLHTFATYFILPGFLRHIFDVHLGLIVASPSGADITQKMGSWTALPDHHHSPNLSVLTSRIFDISISAVIPPCRPRGEYVYSPVPTLGIFFLPSLVSPLSLAGF